MNPGVGLRRVVLCLLVAFSLAPAGANAQTQTATVTVTQIQSYLGSRATGVLVFFTAATPGLGGCPYSNGDEVWIDFSAQVSPSGRDLYAQVLGGFLSGRSFVFYVTGCDAVMTRPTLTAVSVY